MLLKNTKTGKINKFARKQCDDWRGLTSEELTQYTTDKEEEFLLKEKEIAIETKIKELTTKSILGNITQEEQEELQTMIDNL